MANKVFTLLSSENDTCVYHFERKVASLLAEKQFKLSDLKFGNETCVHHFETKVASLLAREHLKLSSQNLGNDTCPSL